MTRINVYLPDELAERVKAADLNVSALVQAVLTEELQRRATDAWLAALPTPSRAVPHAAALSALDDFRAELGDVTDA